MRVMPRVNPLRMARCAFSDPESIQRITVFLVTFALAAASSMVIQGEFVITSVMVELVSYGIRSLMIVCDWLLGDALS